MQIRIGFEIHQQLATKRKLFCNCPTDYRDAPPNSNVCPICTGMPGAKPLPPNRKAVEAAIEIGLILGCQVITDKEIYILRKHYDYPDLPSGYQRTSQPIAVNGSLEGVRIREVHLEEDPGQYNPERGVVDFNRSGIPLVEIVTEPDITSPEQARNFLKALCRTLEYTGKVRPEAGGAVRADVNISLEGGGRVEIKNINSIHGAYRALKFEIMRQKTLLERGEQVKRETRAYLEGQMITVPMRKKEWEEDYRYIPDPDLYPLLIDQPTVDRIKSSMPEPPHLRCQRLVREFNIPQHVAEVIVSEKALADMYEETAKQVNPQLAAKWFRTKLKKVLNYMRLLAEEVPFSTQQLIQLLKMVEGGEVTPEQGELILRRLAESPKDPRELAKEMGFQLLAPSQLIEIVDQVINENPAAVKDYKSGKKEALHFLVGQIMRRARMRADPREISRLLIEKIATSEF